MNGKCVSIRQHCCPRKIVRQAMLRHLEIKLPVSELEQWAGCHPERSEGSVRPGNEILRCAQDDRPESTHVRSRRAFSPHVYVTLDIENLIIRKYDAPYVIM